MNMQKCVRFWLVAAGSLNNYLHAHRFKQQYPMSEASYVSTLRDVPPVSGPLFPPRISFGAAC